MVGKIVARDDYDDDEILSLISIASLLALHCCIHFNSNWTSRLEEFNKLICTLHSSIISYWIGSLLACLLACWFLSVSFSLFLLIAAAVEFGFWAFSSSSSSDDAGYKCVVLVCFIYAIRFFSYFALLSRALHCLLATLYVRCDDGKVQCNAQQK